MGLWFIGVDALRLHTFTLSLLAGLSFDCLWFMVAGLGWFWLIWVWVGCVFRAFVVMFCFCCLMFALV